MNATLNGNHAIVTGSTSGIGLAIAECLAGAGCSISLNGFVDQKAIDVMRKQLERRYNVLVLYHAADISNPASCHALVDETTATVGHVDILVNNAGIQHVAPLQDFATEQWDAVIAVNLSAAFHLTAAVVPGMRSRGYGHIINIASVHGLVASKNKSAYIAAKHGLIGLTKATALETAGEGITCNAICPGWVHTPLVEAQIQSRMGRESIDHQQAAFLMLNENQPSGEFVKPEHVGKLTAFLCSDAASGMTGASVPIDGGWTAR